MNTIKFVLVLAIFILLSGISFAQPYRVIENQYFGLPGESEFIVEDNGTLVMTGANVITFERVRIKYAPMSFKWETIFTPVGRQLVPARWNLLVIQKQITNIDIRLLTATGIDRDRLIQKKAEKEALLSTVEAEILRSPKLYR